MAIRGDRADDSGRTRRSASSSRATKGSGTGTRASGGRAGSAGRGTVRSSKTRPPSTRNVPAKKKFSGRYTRRIVGWTIVNVFLVLALLGGIGAAAGFGYFAYRDYRVQQAHEEAQAAARQVVVDFLTISAKSVTRDIKQVLDGSTGEFHEQYKDGADQVRAAVVENKVDSTGKVLRSGVVSGDLDSAVVIVAVDATIKNASSPKGRKAHYRIQVDMTYDEDRDRWLVSRLEFVD